MLAADTPQPDLGDLAAYDRGDVHHERGHQGDGLSIAMGQRQAGVELVIRGVLPDKLGQHGEHGHAVKMMPLELESLIW